MLVSSTMLIACRFVIGRSSRCCILSW